MSSGCQTVVVAGADALIQKKLELYGGKCSAVQLFFVPGAGGAEGAAVFADVLVLPARAASELFRSELKLLPPVICYGTAERMEACLAAGCRDYLCVPFSPEELFLRVGMCRRQTELRLGGDLLVLGRDRTLSFGSGAASVRLSGGEYSLMRLFLLNRGRLFRRDVLAQILGREDSGTSRTADMTVSRLRRKIQSLTPVEVVSCCRGEGWGILIPVAHNQPL